MFYSKPKTQDKPQIRAVLTQQGGKPSEIHAALVAMKQELLGTTAPITNPNAMTNGN